MARVHGWLFMGSNPNHSSGEKIMQKVDYIVTFMGITCGGRHPLTVKQTPLMCQVLFVLQLNLSLMTV
jgi:hypothetical protein